MIEVQNKKRSSRKRPQSFVRELFEWIKIILVAGIAAFLLNNFVIANSTIPTGSMENTIMAGSRVFGSRLVYRFGEVKRNDIAIFLYGYKCRNDGQTYRETDRGTCPLCGREDKRKIKCTVCFRKDSCRNGLCKWGRDKGKLSSGAYDCRR